MHAVAPCRRSARRPQSDSPAITRRARPTAAVVSPPDDYATVQRAGREFAREYFGRLNATGRAGSVADMFAERARFYAMDSHESRPSVGRADAVEALRRFCRAYGGRGGESRRCVTVLSVDARQDDDGDRRRGTGAAGGDDGRRYELFVRAVWTTPAAAAAADTCPPTSFVQTFSVRRPRDRGPAADRARPLEILSTTVKTAAGTSPPSTTANTAAGAAPPSTAANTAAGASPPSTTANTATGASPPSTTANTAAGASPPSTTANTAAGASPPSTTAAGASPPSTHDFVHSEDTQNNIYSSSKLQSSDKKQLNVGDRLITVNNNITTLSLRPSVTALSSRQSATSTVARKPLDGEKLPRTRWSFGINGRDSKSHKRFSRYKEFENYQKRVETFLKGTGDENNAPTARLCIDGLDTKITADDLYDAFGQFGTVLWVRIITTNGDGVQIALSGYRRPDSRTRCVGHVCFKQTEALTRAMDKQRQAGGCFIRGICMPVRRFVEFDQ